VLHGTTPEIKDKDGNILIRCSKFSSKKIYTAREIADLKRKATCRNCLAWDTHLASFKKSSNTDLSLLSK
jgi:hypothetical protein